MTVPKTRDSYIGVRRLVSRRVPLLIAEIYCLISGNFPIVWTNETGEFGVKVTPASGGVEVGGFSILPAPRSLCRGLAVFRAKRPRRQIPDAQFADNIHAPAQRSGS